MADDGLAAAVTALLDEELVPTVPAVPRLDPVATARSTLARFADPALAHPLAQIAADTSLKIGPRLLAPALELRRAGRAPTGIAAVLGAWVSALRHATALPRDPHAPRLVAAAATDDPVRAVLGLEDLVPAELGHDREFVALVTEAHDRLVTDGTPREDTSWT